MQLIIYLNILKLSQICRFKAKACPLDLNPSAYNIKLVANLKVISTVCIQDYGQTIALCSFVYFIPRFWYLKSVLKFLLLNASNT